MSIFKREKSGYVKLPEWFEQCRPRDTDYENHIIKTVDENIRVYGFLHILSSIVTIVDRTEQAAHSSTYTQRLKKNLLVALYEYLHRYETLRKQ